MECNHVNSIPLDSKRRQTLVEKVREEEGQWRCAERSTWKATVLVLGGGTMHKFGHVENQIGTLRRS